jgi:hypothetical protein
MRKKIKIDFSDFWFGFSETDNYFYNLLIQEFDVEISINPEFLFFSIFGNNHQLYKCKKIFYTGENIAPPLGYADYSFSFDYLDDTRNYRLPHYLLYDGYYELTNKKIDASLANRKFCSFVVSNGACDIRNSFFQKLSKYKKVDSGGRFMNNIGYAIDNKRQFQSEYKFAITFENNAYRPQHIGYSTEKIMEAMAANTMPIYWGNPKIDLEFNTNSFINWYDFKSEDDMIDYIIELDKDDSKYLEKLNNFWFIDNIIPEENKEENIKKFLFKIIK